MTSYYLASTIKQAPVNDVVLCVNTSEQLTIETLYRMPSNHLLKYQIEFSNVKAKFNLQRVDLCGAKLSVAYPHESCETEVAARERLVPMLRLCCTARRTVGELYCCIVSRNGIWILD